MKNLSQQIVGAYEARSAGWNALDAILASKVCPKCGQTRAACQKAVDSMFLCQGDK